MLPANAMSAAPPISVIVVCRNPGPRLRVALAGIWAQRDVALDIVVIDGDSTDGSREWLGSQRSRLGTLISEPDAGVYDAMNKGVLAARGDWILFLGADDRLADVQTLNATLPWLDPAAAGVVAGEAAFDDGRIYKFRPDANPIARNFVHHQSAFYRRSLFVENGKFDASLAVMADYEFNLRLLKNRVPFKPIPLRIATCAGGGISDRGAWRGYREEITVRHRHFPALRCLAWDAASIVRYLRKKIVRTAAHD